MTSRKTLRQHDGKRRQFLKAAGVAMALPVMESFESLEPARVQAARKGGVPKRTVCIGNSFGMYQPDFFPKQGGKNYKMTRLLKPLEKHRKDFTVFSNLDHDIKGGHYATHSFLSGVKSSQAGSMPDGNITLDQRMAEVIGPETRFPSLTVGSTSGLHGGCQMSWTRTGVRVPPMPGPRDLFNKLFVARSKEGLKHEADRFRLQKSILDVIKDEAGQLKRRVSGADQTKLEEYFDSVRDVEKRIQQQQKWHGAPYPKASMEKPVNNNLVDDIPELYELIAIALETDSTRVISLELSGSDFNTRILGIDKGYHSLSHHGKDKASIEALVQIENYQMQQLSKFLDRLKSKGLLDSTAVLFGSGMGNANAHTNSDLPILVAGGGYKLGEHRVMPKEKHRRVPLCNLYLSLLHRMGIQDEYFAKSSGTLTI